MLQLQNETEATTSYAVDFQDGKRWVKGTGPPSFAVSVPDQDSWQRLLNTGANAAAMAFIKGEVDVSGDIIDAIRLFRSRTHTGFFQRLRARAALFGSARLETYFQSRDRATADIRFHYDRSNEFYSNFLDSSFVYSCAFFGEPHWSLEQAQAAKLDSICRKLDLRPGESFLDIGCGWGALVLHAAEHYRVHASGCTLSRNQYDLATSTIAARGLENRARILETDYRNILGRFRKIASIGMFEHVGRHRLSDYFRAVYGLLEDDGLFLNSGITRPQPVCDGPETYFLRKEVFPGGELAHLSNVMRCAENAGFEVVELADLRLHYARTCREWVKRLQRNAKPCIDLVGETTYRTWLLYLAGSVVHFEDGQTGAYQILMAKRGRGAFGSTQ